MAVELGRGERPLGMLSDGLSYKCSAETCPGRLQTCFCNAEPRILASQRSSLLLSSVFSLSLSLSLPFSLFYLASRWCSTTVALDDDQKFQVLWNKAIVGVIYVCRNTLRTLCSQKGFRQLKSNVSLQFVSHISNVKSKDLINYGLAPVSLRVLQSLDNTIQ